MIRRETATRWRAPGGRPAPAGGAPERGVVCGECRELLPPGVRFCTTCGAQQPGAPAEAAAPAAASRAFSCPQCGALVEAAAAGEGGYLSHTCPFCNTPYVSQEPQVAGHVVPEFVVPFSVAAATAQAEYRKWREEA